MGPGEERWFLPVSLNFLESPLTTAKRDRMIRRVHTSYAISSLFSGGVGGGDVSVICSSCGFKLNQLEAMWTCLTSIRASQVDPSECRSRCTTPTQRKMFVKKYKVPLVPDLELQPPAQKKHCSPFHQLQE